MQAVTSEADFLKEVIGGQKKIAIMNYGRTGDMLVSSYEVLEKGKKEFDKTRKLYVKVNTKLEELQHTEEDKFSPQESNPFYAKPLWYTTIV